MANSKKTPRKIYSKKPTRPKINKKIKIALIKEAGGKCANPGCTNRQTEFHHIKEWHVCHTHDQKEMIAICPICHTSVTLGDLKIDDDTIYEWKRIIRGPFRDDQLFIESASSLKVLMGTAAFTSDDAFKIINFSDQNQIGFNIVDGDFYFTNLRLTINGKEIVKIIENRVRHAEEDIIQYTRRPGKLCIIAPLKIGIFPTYFINAFRARTNEMDFAADGNLTLLDIEVIGPGKVRIKGTWVEKNRGIIITDQSLTLCSDIVNLNMVPITGAGETSILKWSGPAGGSFFGFK
jgi:hypothetical protein